ncbi:MAG: hypothetical protein KAH54_04885 [Candidatus Sabulitectum sp.]|nr:hypothetical protein [Candidatus Sabulitectum sp.]
MLEEKAEALKFLLKRFLIALPFFVVGVVMMTPVSLASIFGILPMVLGGFLLAKPLVTLLGNSAGSVIFPQSTGGEVHHMFSITETRIMQQKYDEALKLLKDMIREDPDRLEVYQRIMKLAVVKMKQPEIAKDAFHAGLENVTDLHERKVLAEDFKELMGESRDKEQSQARDREYTIKQAEDRS